MIAIGLFNGAILAVESVTTSVLLYDRQHSTFVRGLAFRNEAQFVSLGDDGLVVDWSIEPDQHYEERISSIASTYDRETDSLAVVDSAGAITIRSLASRSSSSHKLLMTKGWVRGLPLVFDHAARCLAAATDDGSVVVSDLTGKPLKSLIGHSSYVTQLVFSSAGYWVSVGSDDKVCCWSWPDGKKLWDAQAHNIGFRSLNTAARLVVVRARVYCCGLDGVIRVHDLESGEPLSEIKALRGSIGVSAGLYSTRLTVVQSDMFGGVIGAAGIGTKAAVYHSATDSIILGPRHEGICSAVCLLETFPIAISGGTDGVLTSWDISSGAEIWRQPLQSSISFIACSGDDQLLAVGCHRGQVLVVEAQTGLVHRCISFNGPISEGQWTGNSKVLMVSGHRGTYILERIHT